jgi:putative ABC transport system permease protein
MFRNLRSRGWRATLSMFLLAVALSANAVVFSVADSLVFRRLPYPDADRLVEIQRVEPGTGRANHSTMSAALLDEWRRQTDLFASVHGYLTKTLFLSGAGEPEMVRTADVTVGLIELLGAGPRWGRSFAHGDDRQLDLQPVLLAESLARARFGEPAAAIGRRLETTGDPLLVIGVMPADFRFPSNSIRMWRALDPRGPLARGFAGVFSIARVAPGVTPGQLEQMMSVRAPDLGQAAGERAAYSARPGPLNGASVGHERRRLLFFLLSAALCLLLIACANVASLELAGAIQRARTYAIQLALGASRARLVRTAMLEGALLVGGAAVFAAVVAHLAADALGSVLPSRLAFASVNPIDFDPRALLFMTGVAGIVWLLSSLPVVMYAGRGNLLDLLKLEGHSLAATRGGSIVRQTLTVAQVALAVVLLVSSVAYFRSYLALLALDKGFDTSGVVTISLTLPPQAYPSPAERHALGKAAIERLLTRPGVLAAALASAPPDSGAAFRVKSLEIDNRAPIDEDITIAELDVDAQYFSVLRIPIVAGRVFEGGESPTSTMVSETFARRYWPSGNAVGHRFRREPGTPWRHIVGIVGHVRTLADPPGSQGATRFQTYVPRQPPLPPLTTPAAALRDTGGFFRFIDVMARVDSRSRAGDLFQTVRAIDSRFILKVDFVEDIYAEQFDDRLLATQIISGFGVLAFLIAAAGIYSVMAFLVAQRAREIGIRMALGADARRINQLVLGSSLRLAALGAAIGVGGAIGMGRWAQSQLFGVSASDPATITLVSLGVVATALAATWQPARHAGRIDPRILLKN